MAVAVSTAWKMKMLHGHQSLVVCLKLLCLDKNSMPADGSHRRVKIEYEDEDALMGT